MDNSIDELLNHHDPEKRLQAIQQIRQNKDSRYLILLHDLAQSDEDEHVRYAAFKATMDFPNNPYISSENDEDKAKRKNSTMTPSPSKSVEYSLLDKARLTYALGIFSITFVGCILVMLINPPALGIKPAGMGSYIGGSILFSMILGVIWSIIFNGINFFYNQSAKKNSGESKLEQLLTLNRFPFMMLWTVLVGYVVLATWILRDYFVSYHLISILLLQLNTIQPTTPIETINLVKDVLKLTLLVSLVIMILQGVIIGKLYQFGTAKGCLTIILGLSELFERKRGRYR